MYYQKGCSRERYRCDRTATKTVQREDGDKYHGWDFDSYENLGKV